MDETLSKIITIIKENEDLNPKMNPDEIIMSNDLKTDLGFDSLALMSLVYELQEHFPEIDEMEIANWTTIDDCVKYIKGL